MRRRPILLPLAAAGLALGIAACEGPPEPHAARPALIAGYPGHGADAISSRPAAAGGALAGLLLTAAASGCAYTLAWSSLCGATERRGDARLSPYKRMQRRDEYRLTEIGWLAEALRCGNKHTRPETAAALTRLLVRIAPDNDRLLDSWQRTCLYRELATARVRDDAGLLLAIIAAAERLGDCSAIPYIRSAASRPAFTQRSREVRDAAQRCLPVLLQREDEVRTARSLLRPSSPDMSGSTLVRAYVEQPADEPDTLLRSWLCGERTTG